MSTPERGAELPRVNEVTLTYDDKTSVTSYVQGDTIHLDATGQIDWDCRDLFKEAHLVQLRTFPETFKVETDFTKVTFIDSTALKIMAGEFLRLRGVAAKKESQEASYLVKLSDRSIAKVFEITALDRLLKVELVDQQV